MGALVCAVAPSDGVGWIGVAAPHGSLSGVLHGSASVVATAGVVAVGGVGSCGAATVLDGSLMVLATVLNAPRPRNAVPAVCAWLFLAVLALSLAISLQTSVDRCSVAGCVLDSVVLVEGAAAPAECARAAEARFWKAPRAPSLVVVVWTVFLP